MRRGGEQEVARALIPRRMDERRYLTSTTVLPALRSAISTRASRLACRDPL